MSDNQSEDGLDGVRLTQANKELVELRAENEMLRSMGPLCEALIRRGLNVDDIKFILSEVDKNFCKAIKWFYIDC